VIFLFIKFKGISLFCDEDIISELDKYLNLVEDNYQRIIIETKIKKRFLDRCKYNLPKNHRLRLYELLEALEYTAYDTYNFDLYAKEIMKSVKDKNAFNRNSCIRILLNAIGFKNNSLDNIINSNKTCELAIKMYQKNDYNNLADYDRLFLLRFCDFDIRMIILILKYRYGKEFEPTNFYNNMHYSKRFAYAFEQFKMLYIGMDEQRLFEYLILYSGLSHNASVDKKPRIVSACEIFKKYELDFFIFTDQNVKNNKVLISTTELYGFAKNIERLNIEYGINWKDLFAGKIPRLGMVEQVLRSLPPANSANFLKFKNKVDSKIFSEYILWDASGLAIQDYISKGYKTLEQLRFIRYILKSNKDPDDYNINPNMTVEDMKICLELSSSGNKNPVRMKRHINRGNEWYSINGPSKR